MKNGPIAVLFDRLGPYHWARLQAAARLFRVVAVETSATTREYQWEGIDEPRGFDKVTLFDNGSDSRSFKRALLRQKMATALGEVDPAVAMIPGWATPASLIALEWSGHLLVGTKTVASAVNVVHAWRGSYIQPRPRHNPSGALACHICLLFVRLTENWAMKRFGPLPQLATVAPANAGPGQVLAGQLSQ